MNDIDCLSVLAVGHFPAFSVCITKRFRRWSVFEVGVADSEAVSFLWATFTELSSVKDSFQVHMKAI